VATLDLAWWEDAGQGAGGEYRVCYPDLPKTGKSPEHLGSGIELHCVDQEGTVQVFEGEVASQALNQVVERLPPVDRWRLHSLERHVHVSDLEDVPPLDPEAALGHLADWHPGSPRGGNQRTHAGSDHEAGDEAPLLQCPENSDMGQPFEAAAT